MFTPYLSTSPFFLTLIRYGEARTLIEQVFGPKLDPDFYKKYLESESCGNGFYPSTGKANYKHEGVDLEAQVDAQVSESVAEFHRYI